MNPGANGTNGAPDFGRNPQKAAGGPSAGGGRRKKRMFRFGLIQLLAGTAALSLLCSMLVTSLAGARKASKAADCK